MALLYVGAIRPCAHSQCNDVETILSRKKIFPIIKEKKKNINKKTELLLCATKSNHVSCRAETSFERYKKIYVLFLKIKKNCPFHLLMFDIIYVQSVFIASAPSVSCVLNCEMYQTPLSLMFNGRPNDPRARETPDPRATEKNSRALRRRQERRKLYLFSASPPN